MYRNIKSLDMHVWCVCVWHRVIESGRKWCLVCCMFVWVAIVRERESKRRRIFVCV